MPKSRSRMRAGFSLVECMLASVCVGIVILVLLEAVITSSRIAHENSQRLAADAVCWDAAWKKFNEDFTRMAAQSENLTENAAPELYNSASPASISLAVTTLSADLKRITSVVSWGPRARRKAVTNIVLRSSLRRVPWK